MSSSPEVTPTRAERLVVMAGPRQYPAFTPSPSQSPPAQDHLPRPGQGRRRTDNNYPDEQTAITCPRNFDPAYNAGALTHSDMIMHMSIPAEALAKIVEAMDALGALQSGPESLGAAHTAYSTHTIPGWLNLVIVNKLSHITL